MATKAKNKKAAVKRGRPGNALWAKLTANRWQTHTDKEIQLAFSELGFVTSTVNVFLKRKRMKAAAEAGKLNRGNAKPTAASFTCKRAKNSRADLERVEKLVKAIG